MHLLLIDEDFPHPAASTLKLLGHDVVTLNELKLNTLGISDQEILAIATQLNRAVVTHNRKHFLQAHRQSDGHAGIIICTRNPDMDALAKNIHDGITTLPSLKGLLIRVYK